MDLILYASVSLAASSLGLPFFQLSKTRGKLPGYLLVLALALALAFVALNTISPQPATDFGSLLSSDSLGGLFALVTLSVTLTVAVVSIPTMVARVNRKSTRLNSSHLGI